MCCFVNGQVQLFVADTAMLYVFDQGSQVSLVQYRATLYTFGEAVVVV